MGMIFVFRIENPFGCARLYQIGDAFWNLKVTGHGDIRLIEEYHQRHRNWQPEQKPLGQNPGSGNGDIGCVSVHFAPGWGGPF